jgi:hypothetical protein
MADVLAHDVDLVLGDESTDLYDHDPASDHTLIPFTDADCRYLLDDAITCLILERGGHLDDPGATISVLVSLMAEAECRLPDAVADARDRGYSWNSIVERLATTIPAARYRHVNYTRWRRDSSNRTPTLRDHRV